MKPLQIGILVTNTDESEFAASHPKDGEKFTALLKAQRTDWDYRVYAVKDGVFPGAVDECDGYVITGSPASVNGSESWIDRLMEFIRALDRKRIPTVGTCFGHQAIAKALGGKVEKNAAGWGFGVSPTRFEMFESWMTPTRRTLNLYAAHIEQVTQLPQRAVVLGGSDFCPVSSFRVGDHFFTTQYHPEITPRFFDALTWELSDYLGEALCQEARAQAKVAVDGEFFAIWMVNFLEKIA